MKNQFKKIMSELHVLAWTLAGAGTVLITLSGETKTKGIWISLTALFIHILGIIIKKEKN